MGQAKTEVMIQTGILKCEGNKVYHPHILNDLSHDQSFIFVTLNEFLSDVDNDPGTKSIIFSDNCCSQCKSLKNFFDLQRICNEYQIGLIVKNEVDVVGGLAKIAIYTAISQCQSFFSAEDCVSYLSDMFSQENPSYQIKR